MASLSIWGSASTVVRLRCTALVRTRPVDLFLMLDSSTSAAGFSEISCGRLRAHCVCASPARALSEAFEPRPAQRGAALRSAAHAAQDRNAGSEARKRAARKAELAEKMFARGYDFGWADTPLKDEHGTLQIKPGWISKLGIERRRRFHDFRDTAASHLLSGSWGERWSLQDVSDFIGHSDVKVTQERYASLLTEAKTRLAPGIRPDRLCPAAPSKIGHTLANGSLTGGDLTAENSWAPEPGLAESEGAKRLTLTVA
jgi:hypothetical protein